MDPASSEKHPVRVTIFNQNYSLLAKGDPREVEEIAQTVDKLMLSIADKSPSADSTRIAVLACLHLADRLRSLEHDLTTLKERVGRKSGELAVLLEEAIESP